MDNDLIYIEKLQSNRTLGLFTILTFLFFSLFIWQVNSVGYSVWSYIFAGFSVFFLFYVFNYRVLVIKLTSERLTLKFGIFTWTVPHDNIDDCHLDNIPALLRYGGAGIHFRFVRGRYRASFNFLEYPGVVIALKVKNGPVRDISFSTRQPQEIVRLIKKYQSTQHKQP